MLPARVLGGIVVDYNNPGNYRFEWNKGYQPWCRSREMDNFLKWLAGILGTVAFLIVGFPQKYILR
jgi:hypothetical protein